MTNQYVFISEAGYGFLINEGTDSLSTLQTLVDGLIECVYSREYDCDVWVNEEGLFRQDFGVNMVASRITNQVLVGPAVLTNADKEGRTVGLSEAQLLTLVIQGLELDDNDGQGWEAGVVRELVLV